MDNHHAADGFANGNLFADSQQPFHHAYDNFLSSGADQTLDDASWGVNASGYQNPSRAAQQPQPQPQHQSPVPGWQHNPNNLSVNTTHASLNGQPYARSLSHSPAPFAQNAFANYGNQQNYQYGQTQYDPALFNQTPSGQDFNPSYATYSNQAQSVGTIAPQALEQDVRPLAASANPYHGSGFSQSTVGQPRSGQSAASGYVDQSALISAIPRGDDAGLCSVINYDRLARATNSERMGDFLNIGKEVHDWPVNRTTTLPLYVPRKSRNELRKLAGSDRVLLAKIGKKSTKHKVASSTPGAPTPLAVLKAAGSPSGIKYEGDISSSEEEPDDDDDSSYTSEEDLEGSPLPSKRPDNPGDAVEYDTIKAMWRSKRKAVDSAAIRKAITDFWEVIKTIRDRWKSDSSAVLEAEKKGKTSDLPLLKTRVKDQRNMMEVAFKAALKHGHRSIVELLAENVALVYLCYQFLLDRVKEEDFNGPLSRVILETMSQFTTLTGDLLERTHLVKLLPRFIKRGDAKTQFYAKRITTNAASASRQKSADSVAVNAATVSKPARAESPPRQRSEPDPVAGIKRSASSAGVGGPPKKVAGVNTKLNGPANATKAAVSNKLMGTGETVKPPSTTVSAPTTKTKQVTAKPSNFFSTLQSAAKKPGTSIRRGTPAMATGSKLAEKRTTPTVAAAPSAAPKSTFSFAETMANLAKPKEEKTATSRPERQGPLETVEEKAKRLRKEDRRKLHVSFKKGEDLVEVRYFSHDPNEELGHEANQVRDVADVGGEGRVLKMHMTNIDDEEDATEEEPKMIDFQEPTPIDFSEMEPEVREKNYAPFGGGELGCESAERTARERSEANTLMVFYADDRDIPPNPREPTDPYHGEPGDTPRQFGVPEQSFGLRARQRKAALVPQRQQVPAQANAPPNVDLSVLGTFMNHQAQPQPALAQLASQQAPAAVNPDIQAILQSLQQSAGPQVQPQPQALSMPNFNAIASAPPAPAMAAVQPPPASSQPQIDLAAIMAQITGGQQGGAPQFGGAPAAAAAAPMLGGFPPAQAEESADRPRWRDHGEKNHRNYKTKVCKYWQEGRCMKGDGCTYLHEPAA